MSQNRFTRQSTTVYLYICTETDAGIHWLGVWWWWVLHQVQWPLKGLFLLNKGFIIISQNFMSRQTWNDTWTSLNNTNSRVQYCSKPNTDPATLSVPLWCWPGWDVERRPNDNVAIWTQSLTGFPTVNQWQVCLHIELGAPLQKQWTRSILVGLPQGEICSLTHRISWDWWVEAWSPGRKCYFKF